MSGDFSVFGFAPMFVFAMGLPMLDRAPPVLGAATAQEWVLRSVVVNPPGHCGGMADK